MVSKTPITYPAIRRFKAAQYIGLYCLLALLLSACTNTGVYTNGQGKQGQPAEETPGTPDSDANHGPVSLPDNSAIPALLNSSKRARSNGDLPQAMSYIERALRLEPKHAELWLALAELHLESLNFQASEQVARKALTFTDNGSPQNRSAWQIIASSLEASGSSQEAKSIRQALKVL